MRHRWPLYRWSLGVQPFRSAVNVGVQFNLGMTARTFVLWWT
jgi:hypothetical protein